MKKKKNINKEVEDILGDMDKEIDNNSKTINSKNKVVKKTDSNFYLKYLVQYPMVLLSIWGVLSVIFTIIYILSERGSGNFLAFLIIFPIFFSLPLFFNDLILSWFRVDLSSFITPEMSNPLDYGPIITISLIITIVLLIFLSFLYGLIIKNKSIFVPNKHSIILFIIILFFVFPLFTDCGSRWQDDLFDRPDICPQSSATISGKYVDCEEYNLTPNDNPKHAAYGKCSIKTYEPHHTCYVCTYSLIGKDIFDYRKIGDDLTWFFPMYIVFLIVNSYLISSIIVHNLKKINKKSK